MLERFKDPQLRARIVAETEQAMNARFNGADGVFLPTTKQQLADIMREMNVSAGEAVVRILEQGNATAILRFGSEEDLVRILKHPTTSVACDCGASTDTRQHPRAFGTFPRVLGRYVREQKVLTWEDAIRKMTALPANTIGMVDRGFLAPGMAADVTVFDPNTVIDHATYDDAGQLPDGIRHVLVNGRLALRDGKVTGEQAGRVLTRTAHMPRRAMNINATRVVSISGGVSGAVRPKPYTTSGAMRVSLDLTQTSRAPRATGTLTMTDGASNATMKATQFGVLQTTHNWASFTARVRGLDGGADRAALVIVEREDPFVEGKPATLTISIDGASPITARLSPVDVQIRTAAPGVRARRHE